MKFNLRIRPTKIAMNESIHRTTAYRHRIKNQNPEEYAIKKSRDADRKKKERARLKADTSREARMKKKHAREMQRECQKRYRERKKAEKEELEAKNNETTPTGSSILCDEVCSSRREYHRTYRRKERASLSRQKVQAIRQKDRTRKKTENYRTPSKFSTPQLPSLLNSPTTYATKVAALIDSATPRKKTILLKSHNIRTSKKERKAVEYVASSAKDISNNIKNNSKKSLLLRSAFNKTLGKSINKGVTASILGVNRKAALLKTKYDKIARKRRADCVSKETTSKIINFYRSPMVSRQRPEIRFKGQFLMFMSQRQAHRLFKKEHSEINVSLSTFQRLKPKYVLKYSRIFHFTCQCPYCVNAEIVMESINRCINRSSMVEHRKKEMKLYTVHDLMNIIMCEKEAGKLFHASNCINGTCRACAETSKQIGVHYEDIINIDGQMKWQSWERKEIEVKVRKDGAFKKELRWRRVLAGKEGSIGDAVEALVKSVDHPARGVSLRQHILTANWQNKQFELMKKTIQPGTIIAVYDFAQNYSTILQNEIKSAHYGKNQITLHPIPCYYFDNNKELTRESVVILSDDINHDHYAVSEFRKKLVSHLQNQGIRISHLVEWCDGAGSQYKSVYAFHDIAEASLELGFPITRCFFGSEHGKGESDGESGVVKSKVAEFALRPDSNIQCAAAIKKFGDEHLTKLSTSKFQKRVESIITKRSFHVVNDIPRPLVRDDLSTIKGSMKFHVVASMDKKNFVMSRNLACFCKNCKSGIENCVNSKFVRPLVKKQISGKRKSEECDGEQKKMKKPTSNLNQSFKRVVVAKEKLTNKKKKAAETGETCKLTKKKLIELSIDSVSAHDWVKVVYEEEIFLGLVLEVVANQCRVRCLKLPFGIHKLQELESESDAVFYQTVYDNDGHQPILKPFGRGWRYIY